MKPRHIAMGIALVIAGGLVLFGDRTPDGGIAEPVQRTAAPRMPAVPATSTAVAAGATADVPGRAAATPPADLQIVRLVPRDELLGADSDDSETAFLSQNWTPPPPPPPPQPAGPPPAPAAPPLPFTFIGKARANGVWEVYLTQGDRVLLVKQGEVLEGSYRVDSIAPPNLTLTYLPLNQVQTLNIGVTD